MTALRQRLGQLLLQGNKAQEALEQFRANMVLEGRLSRRDWTMELNTSGLATGLYVVRLSTSEGNFTTKVTIQH